MAKRERGGDVGQRTRSPVGSPACGQAKRDMVVVSDYPSWYVPSTAKPSNAPCGPDANGHVLAGKHPIGEHVGPSQSMCGTCLHLNRTRTQPHDPYEAPGFRLRCSAVPVPTNSRNRTVRIRWQGCAMWEPRTLISCPECPKGYPPLRYLRDDQVFVCDYEAALYSVDDVCRLHRVYRSEQLLLSPLEEPNDEPNGET